MQTLLNTVELSDIIGCDKASIEKLVLQLKEEVEEIVKTPDHITELRQVTLENVFRCVLHRNLGIDTEAKDLRSVIRAQSKKEIKNLRRPKRSDIYPDFLVPYSYVIGKTLYGFGTETGCPVNCPECFEMALVGERAVVDKNVMGQIFTLVAEGAHERNFRNTRYHPEIPLYLWTDSGARSETLDIIEEYIKKTELVPEVSTCIPTGRLDNVKKLWKSKALVRISIPRKNHKHLPVDLVQEMWHTEKGLSLSPKEAKQKATARMIEEWGEPGNPDSYFVPYKKTDLSFPGKKSYDYREISDKTTILVDGTTIAADGVRLNYCMDQSPLHPGGAWIQDVTPETEWFFLVQSKYDRFDFLPLEMMHRDGMVEKRSELVEPQIISLLLDRGQREISEKRWKNTFENFLNTESASQKEGLEMVSYYLGVVQSFLSSQGESIKAYREIRNEDKDFVSERQKNENWYKFLYDKESVNFADFLLELENNSQKYSTWDVWQICLHEFLNNPSSENIKRFIKNNF